MPSPMPQLSYAGEQPVILSDDGDTDLISYLDTLIEYRWTIMAVALVVTLIGTLYAFVARPVRRA